MSFIFNALQQKHDRPNYATFMDKRNGITGADYETQETETGFECTMESYYDLSFKFLAVSLGFASFAKELSAAIAPEEIGLSFSYFYDGMIGAQAWTGYLTAAAYYFAEEFGYGIYICYYAGYADMYISIFYAAIDFNESCDYDDAN